MEDQLKTLRREARALQTPAGTSSVQDDSDPMEEGQLNVYQRAKRGLPPLGVGQSRGAPTAARGKGAVEKGTKRSSTTKPAHDGKEGVEGGDEVEAGAEASKSGSKPEFRRQDDEEEEDDADGRGGGESGALANAGLPAVVA